MSSLKAPNLEWKTHHIRSAGPGKSELRASAAIVCDHYGVGDLAEMNEAQVENVRVVTPHVGMRFRMEFVHLDAVIYTSTMFYKPVGRSLVEVVSEIKARLFPEHFWPADPDGPVFSGSLPKDAEVPDDD